MSARVRRAELLEAPIGDAPVPRAELDEWRERFDLVAGVTWRGTGTPPYSLALRAPHESAEIVLERFRAFRAAMRPAFTALQLAHQIHGVTLAWHARVAPGLHVGDDTDGHATSQPGLLVAVTVADCVPVYLAARTGAAWALLHAGWRGIAAGVLERGLALLRRRARAGAEDVMVHLGVAICGSCYEVGPEVLEAVQGRRAGRPGRLDLRAALAERAVAAGVREITTSPLCTSCDRDRFFSHRASGGGPERQIAYLGRPIAAS
jgi:hypothetical protein